MERENSSNGCAHPHGVDDQAETPDARAHDANRGAAAEEHLDHRGAAAEEHLDHRGAVAEEHLDHRGAVVDEHLDHRGAVVDEHIDGSAEKVGHGPGHVHSHGHAHGHTHGGANVEGRLAAALALTLGFMLLEAVAGWWLGSLALVSDAGHMLADSGALGLALVAQRLAGRPRTPERTYGFRRAETLAALANGVALGGTALWVILEAFTRWRIPRTVMGGPMLVVAVSGLLINVLAAWILASGIGHNLNTRAAFAHVLSDALGSVAAGAAAIAVLLFNWQRADAIASLVIASLILWASYRLVTQTVSVLMESAPTGVDSTELERTIRETPGVAAIHDLHAWTISDGFDVVTVHVVLDGTAHGTEVAREVGHRIHRVHKVAHVTVQPEAPSPRSLHPAEFLVRRKRV